MNATCDTRPAPLSAWGIPGQAPLGPGKGSRPGRRSDLDLVEQALYGRPVCDEERRVPPVWSRWHRDLVSGNPEVARVAATAIIATRRRLRQQDAMAAALRSYVDAEYNRFTETSFDSDGQLTMRVRARLDAADAVIDGEPVRVTLGPSDPETGNGWYQTEDRAASVSSIARDFRRCTRTWLPMFRADGRAVQTPMGCGSVVCPVCSYRRRRQRVKDYTSALVKLASSGHTLLSVTTTHRAPEPDVHASIAVTADERRRLNLDRRQRVRGSTASATGGMPLCDAIEGMDREIDTARRGSKTVDVPEALRAIVGRSRARSRYVWSKTVAGELDCMEATIKAPRPCAALRWHLHHHRIIVLRPGVDPDAWWSWWMDRWCDVADASPRGQHMRVIHREGDPIDVDAVTGAVRHAIKYPGKLDDMTAAAVAEFVSAMKGRRPHRARGCLHGASPEHVKAVAAIRYGDDAVELDATESAVASWVLEEAKERAARAPVVGSWARVAGDNVHPVSRSSATHWHTAPTRLDLLDGVAWGDTLPPPVASFLGLPLAAARALVGVVRVEVLEEVQQARQFREEVGALLLGHLRRSGLQPLHEAEGIPPGSLDPVDTHRGDDLVDGGIGHPLRWRPLRTRSGRLLDRVQCLHHGTVLGIGDVDVTQRGGGGVEGGLQRDGPLIAALHGFDEGGDQGDYQVRQIAAPLLDGSGRAVPVVVRLHHRDPLGVGVAGADQLDPFLGVVGQQHSHRQRFLPV